MEDRGKVQEWSNKRLQAYVKDEITKMFEKVLDYTEVGVADNPRYQILRGKILRVGNDAIRSINSELDRNYEVEFNGISQDIVRIKSRRGDGNDRR